MMPKIRPSQIKDRIHLQFSTLTPRDRRALSVLGCVVFVIGVWGGLWQPLERMRADKLAAYTPLASDLSWMTTHKEEARARNTDAFSTPAQGDQSLLSLASDTSTSFGVSFTNAEPGEDGSLRLTLSVVPFSHLLSWLDELRLHHDVRVTAIVIDRQASSPGYVNCKLTLRE